MVVPLYALTVALPVCLQFVSHAFVLISAPSQHAWIHLPNPYPCSVYYQVPRAQCACTHQWNVKTVVKIGKQNYYRQMDRCIATNDHACMHPRLHDYVGLAQIMYRVHESVLVAQQQRRYLDRSLWSDLVNFLVLESSSIINKGFAMPG